MENKQIKKQFKKNKNKSKQIKEFYSKNIIIFFGFFVFLNLFLFPSSANAASAAFDVDATAGVSPFTVNFEYIGDGNPILSLLWDFGDGTTSSEQNPSHTYSTETNINSDSIVNSRDLGIMMSYWEE